MSAKILSNEKKCKYFTGTFAMSAPKLYRHYDSLANNIRSHYPELCLPHADSVFMATTINLGDKVVTRRHRDEKNLANGLCGVVSLGNYDYKHGGHLVLHEPKIILEFPPNWVIFLPSACIEHSNIGISDKEWRSSITYYTAGGLFRWVAYGYQCEGDVDPEQLQRIQEAGDTRWNEGIDLLSKVGNLKKDIISTFS